MGFVEVAYSTTFTLRNNYSATVSQDQIDIFLSKTGIVFADVSLTSTHCGAPAQLNPDTLFYSCDLSGTPLAPGASVNEIVSTTFHSSGTYEWEISAMGSA